MGRELVPGGASTWISKPEDVPQRLMSADRGRLRRAEVDRAVAEIGTRSSIETAGMRAQALDGLTRFAVTSLTDRTMQAHQEAERSGLADDTSYRMNIDIILRGLATGYGRIGDRISGGGW